MMNAKTVESTAWKFGSDVGVRNRLFIPEVFCHPAKLHLGLLQKLIDLYTYPGDTILDPMAGSGSLLIAATQQRNVILRDLQPEYVELMNASLPLVRQVAGLWAGLIDIGQSDAKELECPPFDHIITSPPYGFETGTGMSAARRARVLVDKQHGKRWAKYLSDPTHASFANGFRYAGGSQNTGNKSGRNYWNDMSLIYDRLIKLMPSGGLLILVIKNHYRRGALIDVSQRTITQLESMNIQLVAKHGRLVTNPSLWQRRRREQGLPIVDVEDVLVFKK